jgi:3-isopropylmalate dehydratase small subunit
MSPLKTLIGPAISLPEDNVDTDIIYPARFLLITEKKGLGRYAFHDRPDRSFLDPPASILVAGANFGCGSSREQAPWALADLGIRAVIAPSFGEIFFSNCFKNGMLAIPQPAEIVARLHAAAAAGEYFAIDLEARTLETPATGTLSFAVGDDHRESLLNGWDEIARIRALHGHDIAGYEDAQRRASPWLWMKDETHG